MLDDLRNTLVRLGYVVLDIVRKIIALICYPTPVSLTYYWNFGVYSLFSLIVQIVTGLFLSMHYVPDLELAFLSVDHINRNVEYGFYARYIHATTASFFFICVYIHTLRGIYYGSFLAPRRVVWVTGVAILILMIITAFLGYVLPWGQMSLWGATVITNLFSAIPLFGKSIVQWLWGGFSIEKATLERFFGLHFFLPFVISSLVGIHIYLLHLVGSNNRMGIPKRADGGKSFSPFYVIKDLHGIVVFFFILTGFLIIAPNFLGHPDNYIMANPLVTPEHIVPEWYFLPFYAILRSIPDKLGGVAILGGAIISLFLLPVLHLPQRRSMRWRPFSAAAFWYFVVTCLLLGFFGSQPIESPFYQLGAVFTAFYFFYFYILAPFIIATEWAVWTPQYSKYLRRWTYGDELLYRY